ncbi:MAG: exosortase A [Pseudomonadota bacterium]
MSGSVATRVRSNLQPAVLGIVLLVIAILWLYRDAALRMVALWGEAETFAHGYMVPVIVLWLLWRKREAFAAMAPSFAPSPSALLGVAAAGVLWLVGDVAAINPAMQFALVAFIVLTVPALAGWPATRVIMFPLGFLFFAVPFGDFLLPTLMARTADFTVAALRASGIPVYRDGLQFVIPSGTWSVVEACSGVRYLLASLMVGALFAYLNYRSMKRRWLFMLVALAVPIVANWVRAYMIVLIGHLSNNTLAVGVDHLLYGWVFFGIVVGLMFVIGARWAELPVNDTPARALPATSAAQPAKSRSLWLALPAMATLLVLPMLLSQSLYGAEDHSTPQLAEPSIAGATSVADSAMPAWVPGFVNPAATLERRYSVDGRPVGLYIGYYRGQGPARKLVSSTNTLARSGDTQWNQTETGSRGVEVAGRGVTVKTARLRRRVSSQDPTTLIAWQVYWVNGRFEGSDARAKAWGAWYRLLGRGDDGAVVVVYAQEQQPGQSDALLEAFVRGHFAAIDAQLRKTRDGD